MTRGCDGTGIPGGLPPSVEIKTRRIRRRAAAIAIAAAALALPLAASFAASDDMELVSLSTVAHESTFSTINDGSYRPSLSSDAG